ncbi:RNA polymerase II transcriptional coactivator KIWI isoform X1 [Physcomitrium patens]|uniref:Transcriptional coactivator p15 (PC4) C-terminal domain-containing protein n=1 Tax=Physcomitrium patens TaxID=3218 RepID=A0A2K1KCY9_PHYPA|nr:RNA polymerase II transcriptional coactivator KIWI-like isoform X1 [Physcomitrium patens]XP_024379709.1 RNA polymerase II transcriptional coactivator KIWI-like isoform X1 [Physcomitrium patens]XP_024379710.1 RNA polymerase II transcriptional coactivator KIWI-like isoform X1 [Physcomitrium patens]PNR51631.1 hypothetical protein PHYPA_010818 [Physcomitrium patens]|eukprot:XP_024379708.1 RNA polymerase II transcriptional coactivator KIWI-like isoform X1 [Physcomitrella patens]
MPKRKGNATNHSDEDEEGTNHNQKTISGDGDSVVAVELSRNRKVVVKKFKGKVFVDIREFFNKEGNELPGKKGISLPLDQWKMFQSHFTGIQELIQSLN